jgi:hypothetical protein
MAPSSVAMVRMRRGGGGSGRTATVLVFGDGRKGVEPWKDCFLVFGAMQGKISFLIILY